MRRNTATVFLFLLVAVLTALQYEGYFFADRLVTGEYVPEIYRDLQHDRAALGTTEDPQARQRYLDQMQIDPATGRIPANIREREVVFARKLTERTASHAAARKSQLSWGSSGPANVGGRTRALAVDIRNEDIIIAGGVSGGLWRSENGGRNWDKMTNPQNLHSVTCIVQNTFPGREDHWYYGTGEIKGNSAGRKGAPYRGDGIFHSSDNGRTWTKLSSTSMGMPEQFNSQFQYVSDMCFVPEHGASGTLYAACVGAVFRSVNDGKTWSAVLGRDMRSEPNIDLNNSTLSKYATLAAGGDGFLFALLSQEGLRGSSSDKGVYRTENGLMWTNITPGFWPVRYARGVMSVSGEVPGVMYLYLNSEEEMIWRYRFDGSTGQWYNLTENAPAYGGSVGDLNSQESYNMVIAVHPEDVQTVYIGGTNLYRSTDGFQSTENTTWIGGYDTTNNISRFANHFVDQHAIVFMPSDPDQMLSANDGGVFVTRDSRAQMPSWQPLNTGYRTSQFFTIGIDAFGNTGTVIGGMMDNGVYVAEAPLESTRWTSLLGGDGAYCAITRSGSYYYASTQNSRIFRLTLNNSLNYTTFGRVDPLGAGEQTGQEYLFINPFELAPENQNVMYLAGGDRIWRNDNLSQVPSFSNEPTPYNWSELPATLIYDGQISALAVSVEPAGIVYYGTTQGDLYRIDGARSHHPTVTRLSNAIFPGAAYLASISVDPSDADHILIAFSNYGIQSLFASHDGGTSFEHVGGNLEENADGSGSGPSVRWVTIVPLKDGSNLYFAGTSVGLYSTDLLQGPSTIWTHESPGGIGNVVVTMIKYRAQDRKLYAATHGNGVYSATVDDGAVVLPDPEIPIVEVGPNYPNPFSASTTIPFSIPEDGMVHIAVYDYTGRLIKKILGAHQFAGRSVARWDGRNEAGARVRPGIYIARLTNEGQSRSIRMVVQ